MLQIGGSGVLVQPMTYIFDEEPERWQKVLAALDIDPTDPLIGSLDAP
jgi:ATP phosphoribosyltransferase